MTNGAVAPADELAGDFAASAAGFLLSGFYPFSGLAAGQTLSGLNVGLDNSVVGSFSGTITISPRSENASGYSGPLSEITITLEGDVLTLLGDVNLDGAVNGLDVDPFVDRLLNGPYQDEADMNEDGSVNGLDVDPFVAAVVGGVESVPEPSSLLLLGLVRDCGLPQSPSPRLAT